MKHSFRQFVKHYSFYLGGDQPAVSWIERLRSGFGAFIGLALVLNIAKFLGELSGLDEWLMASLERAPYWSLLCHKAQCLSPGQ